MALYSPGLQASVLQSKESFVLHMAPNEACHWAGRAPAQHIPTQPDLLQSFCNSLIFIYKEFICLK